MEIYVVCFLFSPLTIIMLQLFITIIISIYTCLFLQFNVFLEVGLLRGSVVLHTLYCQFLSREAVIIYVLIKRGLGGILRF